MSRRSIAFTSGILFVAAASTAALDESADQHGVRKQTQDLRIRLCDASNRSPIEGGQLSFGRFDSSGRPPPCEARSGSDGMATLAIPIGRKVRVVAMAKGFAPDAVTLPEESGGTPEQPVVIALNRAASIHGRLFNAAGEPANGAQFSLRAVEWFGSGIRRLDRKRELPLGQARRWELPRDWETNEVLYGDVPAQVDVELSVAYDKDGKRRWETRTLYLEAGERREIEWRLGARSVLAGRIVDDAGVPVAGASVHASRRREEEHAEDDPVTSDANGRFEVDDLDPGLCIFEIRSPDRHRLMATYMCMLDSGERRDGVAVVIPRAAPLILRPRLPDGSVAFGIFARALTPTQRHIATSEKPGQSAGTVTFDSVHLGEVTVEVMTRSGNAGYMARARFLHDGDHECVVDCVTYASLRGSVEAEPGGAVKKGVKMTLVPRDPVLVESTFRSGTESTSLEFSHDHIAAGKYDLVAVTADGQVGVLPSLELKAGEQHEDVVVRVEPGATVLLQVPSLDTDSSRPIRGFHHYQVRARRGDVCVATTETRPSSHCELTVAPGKLTVEVWSRSDLLASRDVEARPGAVVRVRF